jgi:protein-tyrosine phosphatase
MPKHFSWILENHLAVGSFPQRTSAFFLREMGITAVLSLTEPQEVELPEDLSYNFVWHRIAIPDGFRGGIPKVAHFEEGVNTLKRWRQKRNVLYVHCLAGVGRSTSMCLAYLCQTQNMTFAQALDLIKTAHPIAAPDPNQIQVIQEYLKANATLG